MKNIILNFIILGWVFTGTISLIRTFQFCLFGCSGKWHENMFGLYFNPFIDWWWMIIPSMVALIFFTQFTSQKVQKIALAIFSGVTIFFIVATYL